VNFSNRGTSKRSERGQILPLMALFLVVLLLFAGFAIDLGNAYMQKADLSKAVDAAALMAARNIGQGETTATSLADSAFWANYGSTALVPSVTYSGGSSSCPSGPNGETQVCVTANLSLNTYFMRVLPQWQTLSVASVATALRADAAVTMVLDRSGSMNLNGGCSALAVAIQDFLGYFDTSRDQVGMTGFASNASADTSGTCQETGENCVQPTYNFTSIATTVAGWSCNSNPPFGGGTYAYGGLQNASTWENNITTANVRKAVVFFTDGWANADQYTLSCGTVIMGGCSAVEQGAIPTSDGSYISWCGPGFFFWPPRPGSVNSDNTQSCNGANSFTGYNGNTYTISPNGSSAPPGVTDWKPVQGATTAYYITQDAEYHALQLANTMRSQGITVYSVGLGSTVDNNFLQQLANDPNYPATYNSSQPAGTSGLAVFAPDCPGTGSECTDELKRAFQIVANDIILRLTQ